MFSSCIVQCSRQTSKLVFDLEKQEYTFNKIEALYKVHKLNKNYMILIIKFLRFCEITFNINFKI